MREIQTYCPQCGAHSGYLQPEEGDYTAPLGTLFYEVPWKCPQCGYPEVLWNKYGQTYTPSVKLKITTKIVDEYGNEIVEAKET